MTTQKRTPNPANSKVIEFKRKETQRRMAELRALRELLNPKPIRAKRAHHVQPYNGAVLAFVA